MVNNIRIEGLDDYAVDYGTRFRVRQRAENMLLRLHSYDEEMSITITVTRRSFFSTYYQVAAVLMHPAGSASGIGMNKDLTLAVDRALHAAAQNYKHDRSRMRKHETSLF